MQGNFGNDDVVAVARRAEKLIRAEAPPRCGHARGQALDPHIDGLIETGLADQQDADRLRCARPQVQIFRVGEQGEAGRPRFEAQAVGERRPAAADAVAHDQPVAAGGARREAQQRIEVADHRSRAGHQVVVLGQQLARAVEQFQHRVDAGQAHLRGETGCEERLPCAQFNGVSVLFARAVEYAVDGDAAGGKRAYFGRLRFRHVGDLEAQAVVDAVRPARPQAPETAGGVWRDIERGPAFRGAAGKLPAVDPPAPVRSAADGYGVGEGQPVVFRSANRRQPYFLDRIERASAKRDADARTGAGAQRENRFDRGKLRDAQHVHAILGAVHALRPAVLVELQVVAPAAGEDVLQKRGFQVVVAVVVEGDAPARRVEQRQIVFEEASVFDRAQVERPALAGAGFEAEAVDVGERMHRPVQGLRLELERLRPVERVVGFGFVCRGKGIDVKQPRVGAARGGAQRGDVRPRLGLGGDANPPGDSRIRNRPAAFPGQMRGIEDHVQRRGEVPADDLDGGGCALLPAERFEAVNPGVVGVFGGEGRRGEQQRRKRERRRRADRRPFSRTTRGSGRRRH